MKIFSAKQIRRADLFTIKTEPVSSINLMERAAESCVQWLIANFPLNENFYIFCGNGNNGGDGLAIARLLYLKGYNVIIFFDAEKRTRSEEAVSYTHLDVYKRQVYNFSTKKNRK